MSPALLALSDEQIALKSSAREFLADRFDRDALRSVVDEGAPVGDDRWNELAAAGWLGAGAPEASGGGGAGMTEVGLLVEEAGRVLFPGVFPFHATAVWVLGQLDPGAEQLPALCAGDRRVTLAVVDDQGDLSAVPCARAGDFCIAAFPDSVRLLELTPDAVVAQEAIDLTRPLADVLPDAAKTVSTYDNGTAAVVRAAAAAAVAADATGGMQRVLDETVEYAGVREQFGRPIGIFQAVKHRLADMLTQLEGSRSLAYYAAALLDEGSDATLDAALAKLYTGRAYRWVAEQGVQLHGGIGFTWEHDMHLYLRRAVQDAAMLGDPYSQLALAADVLAEEALATG